MKKILLMAIGLAIAVSANATPQMQVARSFAPDKQIITEQPEGTLVKYKRSGACIYTDDYYIHVGKQTAYTSIVYADDGTTVYINNIFNDNVALMGDGWVQGTINAEGTKITVPVGQTIYTDPSINADVVIAWGSTQVTDTEIIFIPDETVTEVVYNVDPATGVITMTPGEGDLNAGYPNSFAATGLGCYWTDDNTFGSFLDWDLTLSPLMTGVPAVPANPVLYDDSWFDSGSDDGYSCLDFKLPTTDVDGNEIDPELISFSIFTDDDQIFTFDTETYSSDVEEDMTEIPYSIYYNGYDIGDSRVYFYRTNTPNDDENFTPFFTQRIGMQVYYTVDGVKNASEIIYWDLPSTGIETVEASKPTDNVWYNIAGQRFVGKPSIPGIYINNGKKIIVK